MSNCDPPILKPELQENLWSIASGQMKSVSTESLVTTAVFITTDHMWDARDQWLFPDGLGNTVATNPGLKQQCLLLISVKRRNAVFLFSSHPHFEAPLPWDDYVLLPSDPDLPQMWLYESPVKERLHRWLESAQRAGVMEGVYLSAASVNQRLLFNLQEASWANDGSRIKAKGVVFIPHMAVRRKANQLYRSCWVGATQRPMVLFPTMTFTIKLSASAVPERFCL